MRRFFIDQALVTGEKITLSPEETKHAARVLRLQAGAEVILLNGKGLEARARFLSLDFAGAEAEIFEVNKVSKPIRLELLQAPLKGPKMDWLVEKATELGVDAIHPARTARTAPFVEKEDRWARIAQAAVKQSGNANFPDLHAVQSLEQAIMNLPPHAARILLQPGAELSLHEAILRAKSQSAKVVILAIGPEGGFDEQEEEKLIAAGFLAASLSKQVLRGETAALAALAIAAHCIDFSA
jgi:16S rRNA (uracil1498-N3)-methyltransferase